MPLDEAVKRFVTAPLRMPSTGYLPAGDDVAPAGGESEGAEWQAGQPQDGNARFLHGVAGHAGLFTDLEDIIRYASMLAGDGRNEEGVVFSYRSIHLATTERTRGLNEARGYGFRITKRSDPFLGHLWPSDGQRFAHRGQPGRRLFRGAAAQRPRHVRRPPGDRAHAQAAAQRGLRGLPARRGLSALRTQKRGGHPPLFCCIQPFPPDA